MISQVDKSNLSFHLSQVLVSLEAVQAITSDYYLAKAKQSDVAEMEAHLFRVCSELEPIITSFARASDNIIKPDLTVVKE